VVGNVSQTSGIGFGKLDFGSHPAVQAGNYDAAIGMAASPAQVQCTPGATVTMTIGGGQNAMGGQRRIGYGGSYLPYMLTTQPGCGAVVAPGVGVSVDASAGPTLVPVYGRATTPGAGLPAGNYTDTLQVIFVSVRRSHLENAIAAKDARVHQNSWWTRGHYRTAALARPSAPTAA
jgi:spore coat protein U-like protein